MLSVVLVDVGGTLWSNTWPQGRRDDEERTRRLHDAVPALTDREALELVAALSRADHPATERQQTEALVEAAIRGVGPGGPVRVSAVMRAMCLPARGRVELFPGAKALLFGLAERGVRVVVVSNVLWRGVEAYRRDFHDLGLSDYVAAYVSSLDVGWRKPHAAFFDAAMTAAGDRPEHCVMVGDSEANDIVPAFDRGIRAVRVAIEEVVPPTTLADIVCTSLGDVARFLFVELDGRRRQ